MVMTNIKFTLKWTIYYISSINLSKEILVSYDDAKMLWSLLMVDICVHSFFCTFRPPKRSDRMLNFGQKHYAYKQRKWKPLFGTHSVLKPF